MRKTSIPLHLYTAITIFMMGFMGCPVLHAQAPLTFRIPTDNHALFQGDNEGFYMYVDRIYQGVASTPWEGGTYGFTRNLVDTPSGPVAVKFHEGIDIKPIKRDANQVPLDKVYPSAPGRVVHVSKVAKDSSYGRYVVIEHTVPEGKVYTLYAHLADVFCTVGQRVGTGNAIATLGFTGTGIDKRRAHLHFEICLMLNSHYEEITRMPPDVKPINKHGNYNGLNLVGINPSDVLMDCRHGAPFSFSQYWASIPVQYTVRLPYTGTLDLVKRYPFLLKQGAARPASWEIAFSDSGIPLSVTPSQAPCSKPEVLSVKPLPFPLTYRTMRRVQGSNDHPVLSASGLRYIESIVNTTPPPLPASTLATVPAP